MSDATLLQRSGQRVARWWWLLLTLVVIGGVLGGAFASKLQVYRASTTMLIGAPLDGPFIHTEDLDASEELATVMAALVPQQPVLDGVIADAGLHTTWQQLRPRMHASVQGQSHRLIVVTATAHTAAEAEAIVGAVPGSLAAVAFPPSELPSLPPLPMPVSGDGTPTPPSVLQVIARYRSLNHSVSTAHVQVVEPPTIVSGPFPPTLWVIAGAAVAGALLAFLAALSVELWLAPRGRHVAPIPSYAAG
jgi:hypothetical protein